MPQQSILQKFNSIDTSRISKAAADVFRDLKTETKSFTKISASLKKEFNAIYDRLKESKPQAIKGTPEYKAFGKKPTKKAEPKPNNVPKGVWEKYKNAHVDIPRDEVRQAKPFGARVKGKNVNRKPTKADYAAGNVYYEYRPNRADVRKKYPKLSDGGALDKYREHAKENHKLD